MDNHDVTPDGSVSDHAHTPLFTTIPAPIFNSIDPVQVAKFFKERERYELEVAYKHSEMPSLQLTLYTANIDRSLLKYLVFMGSF